MIKETKITKELKKTETKTGRKTSNIQVTDQKRKVDKVAKRHGACF